MTESPGELRSVPSEEERAVTKRRLERNLESRRVRVFISSTFSDCHGERDALQRIITPAVRAWCSSLRPEPLDFSVLDLRWGITSEQVQSGDVLRLCLDEVDRCRPFFIGILTMRYGWHNTSRVTGFEDAQSRADNELLDRCFAAAGREYEWLKDYTDRSLTEVEILHGALRHPELMRNRALFYFRDPAGSSLATTPFASARSGLVESSAESLNASIKQLDLRKEIEKKFPYNIKHYSTLAEFNQLVEADLREVIGETYAATSRDVNLLDIARAMRREDCLQMNSLEEVRLLQESYGRSCRQNFVPCHGGILKALTGYVTVSPATPRTNQPPAARATVRKRHVSSGGATGISPVASPRAGWMSPRRMFPVDTFDDSLAAGRALYGCASGWLLSDLDVDGGYLADWDDGSEVMKMDGYEPSSMSSVRLPRESEAVGDSGSPRQRATDHKQQDNATSPQWTSRLERNTNDRGAPPVTPQTSKTLAEEYEAIAGMSSTFIDSGYVPAGRVGYHRTASGTLLCDDDEEDDMVLISSDDSDSARALGGVAGGSTEELTTPRKPWSIALKQGSMDSLRDELDSRLRRNTPRIVTGEAGCGKSSLLAHVAELARQNGHVVCIHFTSCAAGEDTAEQVMGSILYQAKYAGLPLPKEPPDPSNLAATFHQLLKGTFLSAGVDDPEEQHSTNNFNNNNVYGGEPDDNGDRLLVVCIDALNMVSTATGSAQLSLAWLPTQLGGNVRLMVSTKPGHVLSRLRDERGWEVLELSPIGHGPRRDIITSYLNGMGKKLDDKKLERLVSSEQTSNPLFLTCLLKELCMCATHESLEDILESYLQARTIVELFDLILQRWEEDYCPSLLRTQIDMKVVVGEHTAASTLCPDGTPQVEALKKDFVRNILLSLCLSNRGMREQELHRAWQVTAGFISPLLHAAGDSLLCHSSGCLVIGHGVLEQACRNRYLVDGSGKRNSVEKTIRNNLAGYFEEKCEDNVRRCEELPRHLLTLSTRMHQRNMRHFLSQLSTLAVFSGAGRTYDLLHYWRVLSDYDDARDCYLARLSDKYGSLLEETIYDNVNDDVMACPMRGVESAIGEEQDPAVLSRDAELASDLLFVGKIMCAMGEYATAVQLIRQRLQILVHHGGSCCADSVRASLDLAFYNWKAVKDDRDTAYRVSVQHCIQALGGADQCADDSGVEIEGSASEVQSRIYELLGNLHYRMGASLEKGSKHWREKLESARIFLLLAARYWLMSTAKRNRIVCYATLAEVDLPLFDMSAYGYVDSSHYSLEGEVGRALKLAKRAMKASCQEFGEYHHVTARIRTIYATILKKCGRLEEAQQQMQLVSKVQAHLVGVEHTDTKASLKSVSDLDDQLVRIRSDSDALAARNS